MRKIALTLSAGLLLGAGAPSYASTIVTHIIPDLPQFTTVPAGIPDGGFQNNGIWLTMTSPNPVIIDDFSFPGLTDGQFQLRTTLYAEGPAAEFLVQGLFANGNDVLVAGSGAFPANPARLGVGEVVGPDPRFTDGAGFVALSGLFGNWIDTEDARGFVGVAFANGADLHYGFIDITVLTDGRITLHGYAYEGTPGAPISTFVIPEPSTYAALFGLLGLGLVLWRRRRA